MAYIGAGITRFNTADELTVTGDAQIDTTTLVVDSTNNRVGVGTSSPATTLEVNTTLPIIRSTHSTSGDYLQLFHNGSGAYIDFSADPLIIRGASNAERMRIDTSGNLLVGKTATGLSTTGFQALATGNQSAFISDGDRALILNRQTSDGSILEFRKDNTTVVGSIGTNSNGNFQLFGVAASHVGLQFGSPSILPINNSGASSDNAVDLGDSNVRFKDGYFSNRIYTGGIAGENDTNTQITFPGSDVIKFLTGGGERMRIDASGNLLVGTTDNFATISTTASESGHVFIPSGGYAVARAGAPIYANRTGTDGDIAVFRKDGSTVGSIASSSGKITITLDPRSAATTGSGFLGGDGVIFPSDKTGVASDADVSLGGSSTRFKDLYLSGGAYIGGTGSANKLDDYEEGTWTASYTGGSTVSGGSQACRYTKIGNLVQVTGNIYYTSVSGGSGDLRIIGFPFTQSSGVTNYSTATISVANWSSQAPEQANLVNSQLSLYYGGGTSANSAIQTSSLVAYAEIYFSVTYVTDS